MRTQQNTKEKTSGTKYGKQKYDVVGIFSIYYARDGKEDMAGDVAWIVKLIKAIDKDYPWTYTDDFSSAKFTNMHPLCPQGLCTKLDGTTDGKTTVVNIEVKILSTIPLFWSRLPAFNHYLERIGGEMKRRSTCVKKVGLTVNISSSVVLLD